jgi:hypothetical protein
MSCPVAFLGGAAIVWRVCTTRDGFGLPPSGSDGAGWGGRCARQRPDVIAWGICLGGLDPWQLPAPLMALLAP